MDQNALSPQVQNNVGIDDSPVTGDDTSFKSAIEQNKEQESIFENEVGNSLNSKSEVEYLAESYDRKTQHRHLCHRRQGPRCRTPSRAAEHPSARLVLGESGLFFSRLPPKGLLMFRTLCAPN